MNNNNNSNKKDQENQLYKTKVCELLLKLMLSLVTVGSSK